jgi:hypothetical protein
MKMKRFSAAEVLALAVAAAGPAALGDAVVFSGTGTDADVTAALNDFRNALGALNANVPGSFGSGRREINWDGVPDRSSDPVGLPPAFFNSNAAGRARGVVYESPEDAFFMVSANSENPAGTPINFASLNPQYGGLFRAFSPQRLLALVGGTRSAFRFFVPGTNIPATVSGFGAVFSDVDLADSTEISFIGANGTLITRVFAPVATTSNGGLSFVGVRFDAGERVARVEIRSGNIPIGPGNNEGPLSGGGFADAVAMDDFVFGEPVEQPCAGDVSGDGVVDLGDLTVLLASFGSCEGDPDFNPAAELNGGGCVDVADLAILLANFGNACR